MAKMLHTTSIHDNLMATMPMQVPLGRTFYPLTGNIYFFIGDTTYFFVSLIFKLYSGTIMSSSIKHSNNEIGVGKLFST